MVCNIGAGKKKKERIKSDCSLKKGVERQESSRLGASKTIEVDSCRQKPAQGQRGGGPSTGFHSAQLSIVGVRERCFGFPFSVEDHRSACCTTQQSMRTCLNELLDDLPHLGGELGERDPLGGVAPVIRPQLKF